MTESNIDEIRARLNAASEGPWQTGGDGLVWAPRLGDPVSGSTEPEDAEFIAATRQDVPALIAAVEGLRDALADVVAKSVEHGEQEDGFVAFYILPTGPIHRAIALLQEHHGVTVRPATVSSPRVYDREPPADVTSVCDREGDEWCRTPDGWFPVGGGKPISFPDLRDAWGPITAWPGGGA